MKKILLCVMLVILVLIASSCGSQISQADYDSLKTQLTEAENQLKQLQENLAAIPDSVLQSPESSNNLDEIEVQNKKLAAEIDSLEALNADLQSQIDALNSNSGSSEDMYNELKAKYDELQQKYSQATAPPAVITVAKVEEAVFKAINAERTSRGIPELQHGYNIYPIAQQHSKHMADIGKMEYSAYTITEEIFWAAGYDSLENLTKSVMLTWSVNQYRFEHGLLSTVNKYGAVGAYKSGDIIYITFVSADYP